MQFFDIELIKQRLLETEFGFESVCGAAEYAAVEKISSFRPNTIYVVLGGERNPAGDATQPRGKTMAAVTFGVICVAKNARDARGEQALKDAEQVITRVRNALLGWAPESCKPCIWLQGDVMDYDRTNLLWMDVFTTSFVMGA